MRKRKSSIGPPHRGTGDCPSTRDTRGRSARNLTFAAGLLLVSVSACGTSGDRPPAAAANSPTPPTTAAAPNVAPPVVATPPAPYPCGATTGLGLPPGWPTNIPLPDGLVITRTERRSGSRLIAYGRVPGDFHHTVAFFNTHLPAAGFTQHDGQLDPHDAEADFTSTTTRGRWTTGTSADCPDTSEVTLLVLPAAHPEPQTTSQPDNTQ